MFNEEGKWIHFAVRRKDNRLSFFFNGQEALTFDDKPGDMTFMMGVWPKENGLSIDNAILTQGDNIVTKFDIVNESI